MFESQGPSSPQPPEEEFPPLELLYGVDGQPSTDTAPDCDDAELLPDGDDVAVELSEAELAEFAAWVRARETAEAVERLEGEVDDLDAHLVLARAVETRTSLNRLGGEQLLLACQWADLYTSPHGDDSDRPRLAGREEMVYFGGDGTPKVAEFCPAELATVLGISSHAGRLLIGDALDLRHRHPLLWRRVLGGQADVWTARQVASRSRHLSAAAAARLDRHITSKVGAVAKSRLLTLLDAAILAADPDQAEADTDVAARGQGVWMNTTGSDHGYGTMFAKAPAPDLTRLDLTLDKVAAGSTSTHRLRECVEASTLRPDVSASRKICRAKLTPRRQGGSLVRGRPHDGVAPGRSPDHGTAILNVHLTGQHLSSLPGAGGGVVRVEDVGPVLLDQVREWLGHRHVVVKPVIDLPGLTPVDRYEVPDRLAEAVRLRNPASCFPYSPNTSRSGDNDHTREYVAMNKGGPPGQTRLDNLGRLTRTEHRIKTFTAWRVRQLRSGCWLWRSPHGHWFLVDETGTTDLGTALL